MAGSDAGYFFRNIKMHKIIITVIIFFIVFPLFSITIQEAYLQAEGNADYQKILQLETGIVYTGSLYLGRTFVPFTNQILGEDIGNIKIEGNGAILDLQGGELTFAYTESRFDVENLIILNGNIRFRGMNNEEITAMPSGSVRYCTFYKPEDFAIRLYGCGDGILIERNIAIDAEDTGYDFMYINGRSMDFLPTGINYAVSGQIDLFGIPEIIDNWSYVSDSSNNDLLNHFSLYCEYG